ncbi:MAG: hypothetical protein QOE70_6864 [Chthoniobacter sp.]|jgi:hypothetical protein|nr:hypothetical protein [Chthoniobacter sp.]
MLNQIREYLRAVPFRPFEIHCTNGDAFWIEHPENAAVVAHQVVVALPGGESVTTLSALHIVRASGFEVAQA